MHWNLDKHVAINENVKITRSTRKDVSFHKNKCRLWKQKHFETFRLTANTAKTHA